MTQTSTSAFDPSGQGTGLIAEPFRRVNSSSLPAQRTLPPSCASCGKRCSCVILPRGKMTCNAGVSMNLMRLLVAAPAAQFILGDGAAIAGQTVDDAGALACVNDKRVEKEPEKAHKLADFAGRCVAIANDRSGDGRARPPRPVL